MGFSLSSILGISSSSRSSADTENDASSFGDGDGVQLYDSEYDETRISDSAVNFSERIERGAEVTVNTTSTDYGAIQAAMDSTADVVESSLDIVSETVSALEDNFAVSSNKISEQSDKNRRVFETALAARTGTGEAVIGQLMKLILGVSVVAGVVMVAVSRAGKRKRKKSK